jgi:prevent-host-death family protein
MKKVPVADAKRRFSDLLRAAELGDPAVILRHGKPVAILGPFTDTEAQGRLPAPRRPGGLLSLVGLFEDWDTMDRDVAEIIEARQEVLDRPPADLTS